MPTAVESYAQLGAVVVQLPASTTGIHAVANGADNIGGRSGIEQSTSTLQHAIHLGSPHVAAGNSPDGGGIGGRSGIGTGLVMVHNPHLKTPVVAVTPPTNLSHKTPAHHPAPVHLKPGHPAPVGSLDPNSIPGRSGVSALLPAVHPAQGAPEIAGRNQMSTLPAVQPVATPQTDEAALRPLLAQIGSALQSTLPQGQRSIEALGIGTDGNTLRVLIALLRTQGYHVTVATCDGSVRPGFTGPSAVLRAHGGTTTGVFLQALAAARSGH